MNETTRPPTTSDVPWPTSGQRVPVPDTSMLPGSEVAPPAAVKLLNDAVQGAHNSIDRLAVNASPIARQMGQRMDAAADALHARAIQLRQTRDEWVEGTRTTVRNNPLVAVACAVAIGAVIARVTRVPRITR